MRNRFFRDAFGWGAGLWFLGYMLGIMLFPFVPPAALGWVIMPIGIALALLVLVKRIQGPSLTYYLEIALIWTALAVILDYMFLFKALGAENYYKLDIYIYYALTFALPLAVGAWKLNKRKPSAPSPTASL
jgi:hypothetical protein